MYLMLFTTQELYACSDFFCKCMCVCVCVLCRDYSDYSCNDHLGTHPQNAMVMV